ncbi:MAG: winged helix family transcriptional regulator [Bacteroidetes bacterium]|nr:MAG: winged helix family transcriptional regulator [Bacteroidota bacterium]
MFFTQIMNKGKLYSFSGLVIILLFAWSFSAQKEVSVDFSQRVKIALRDVGNQLLLATNDSTSLVLPVIELNKTKFELSFDKNLSFDPSNLVSIIESSFSKSNLPKDYRVEVIQCVDQEVAYSYEIDSNVEKTIIPCAGRIAPENCYIIYVKFTHQNSSFFGNQTLMYIVLLGVLMLLILVFFRRRKKIASIKLNGNFETIGSFQFYPEQNKLVKQAIEISLSKKECELLEIFVANPNKIIKREELEKRVWEDNGVFVGRSLDTYISKLRKKLKDDDAVKLINVHGVGYKLEVN